MPLPLEELTDETLIVLYWDEEKKLAEIAELYGCSVTTVHDRMNRAGIRRRSTGPSGIMSLSEERIKALKKRYNKGEAVAKLAREFDISRPTVYSIVRNNP